MEKKIDEKLQWVIGMIEDRMINSTITYDVIDDYTPEQQELIYEFLETIIDFDNDGMEISETCGEEGTCKFKEHCGTEKCNFDYCMFGK